MKFLKSYGFAIIVLVLIGAWLLSGDLITGGRGPGNGVNPMISLLGVETEETATAEEDVEEVTEVVLQTVRTKSFSPQQMPIEVSIRGRTEANSKVSVRAETSGIVDAVHVKKGQVVSPGTLLCALDEGSRAVRLAQAEAALAQAEIDFDANKQLRDKGFASSNSGNALEVALRAARSSLDEAQRELDRTQIKSEVAGVIQDPLANSGDMLSMSNVCATVVELDPMLFVGQVPEARVGMIREGLPADVSTVTGETVTGQVRFVSSSADAATRTFEVEVEVPNSDGHIRDGITASAVVRIGQAPAHLVPQSVLTLDDAGIIGVKTVLDGLAQFTPVQLLRDTTDGVWISGLAGSVNVITLGQEYVVDGQEVAATSTDQGTSS